MRWILVAVLLLGGSQVPSQKSGNQQIREAIRALPEALREGAKVVGYAESGERVTLKKGSNGMTCWADDPRPNSDEPFYVVCFPESLERFFKRNRDLKEGKVPNRRKVLTAEIEAGKIPLPEFAMRYTLRGQIFEEALPLTVIHVPYAKTDGTGLSSEVDNFRPWLMWAGTPLAHIMIPGH